MAKFTRATLKKFIRENIETLEVKTESSFDGMHDCVMPKDDVFTKATIYDFQPKHTLGVKGLWTVGESRDLFRTWEDETHKYVYVYNACGTSILRASK